MSLALRWSVKIFCLHFKIPNSVRNGLISIQNQRCLYNLSTMNYTYRDEVNVNPYKEEMDYSIKRNTCYEEYTSLGKWFLEDPARLSRVHVQFKILDYNILAQTHMQHHLELYRRCPRQSLNWSFRRSILRREFEEISPDIFCLQEVENIHKDELLEPWRKRGYGDLYVWRGKGKPDGCAFLYKKTMFRVADYAPINYHRPEVEIMNRPNVGMVVKLELIQHPGSYLVVANTHLLFNPSREDIKLCQLILLLTELKRMAFISSGKQDRYHPIILTGDLNVNPESGLISLLKEGHLDSQTVRGKKKKKKNQSSNKQRLVPTDQLESCLNLSLDGCQYLHGEESKLLSRDSKQSNEHLKNLKKQRNLQENAESTKRIFCEDIRHNFSFDHIHDHPELDNNLGTKMKIFDYMFYSSEKERSCVLKEFKMLPGELRLLSRLRLPTQKEYHSQIRGIPNLAFGSDHFPLVATFLLCASQK